MDKKEGSNFKKVFHKIKPILSLIIIISIFTFFGFRLYSSWHQIKTYEFNYFYAILSIIGTLISTLYLGIIYYAVLNSLKQKVPMIKVVKAHNLSDFASYVPGKVWNLMVRIKILHKYIDKSTIITSSILEMFLMLLLSAIVLFLGLMSNLTLLKSYIWFLLPCIAGLLIIIHPKIMNLLLKIISSIIRKEIPKIKLGFKDLLKLSFITSLYWLINGISLFFSLKTIYPLTPWSLIPKTIAANAGAWSLGFLSTLTPSGIGIREGITSYILSSSVPNYIAIASTIIFRVFSMLTLFIVVMIIALNAYRKHRFKNLKRILIGNQ
ncbi:MAG: flippase-like domain-containing protein [Nanoarchaeota archaeon]|nr:flippase-like domain-containing protein [Nanoarchaeota archaeon]